MPRSFQEDYTPAQRRALVDIRDAVKAIPSQVGASYTSAQMNTLRDALAALLDHLVDYVEGGSVITGADHEDTMVSDDVYRHNFLLQNDYNYLVRFLYETDTEFYDTAQTREDIQNALTIYASVTAAHVPYDAGFSATTPWLDDRFAEYLALLGLS